MGVIFNWLSHQEEEYIVPLLNINWPCDLLGLRLRQHYSFSYYPFSKTALCEKPKLACGDVCLSQDVSEDIYPT